MMRGFAAACVVVCAPLVVIAGSPDKAKRQMKVGVQTPGVQVSMSDLKPESSIQLPGRTEAMVAGDAIYVASKAKNELVRVDPKSDKAESIVTVADTCGGMLHAFGSLWVPDCTKHALTRVDVKGRKTTASIGTTVADVGHSLSAGADSVWLLADEKTTLVRIDPENNRAVAEVRLPAECTSLVFGEEALWVTCPKEDKLLRVDPKTNLVAERIDIAKGPTDAVVSNGSIWVLCRKDGQVVRVDPKTNKTAATIDLNIPNLQGTITAGEGYVWVSAAGFPISRIDPANDKVAQQFTGDAGNMIVVGAGSVWLANRDSSSLIRFDPRRIKAVLAP